jgi:hypothetical protein
MRLWLFKSFLRIAVLKYVEETLSSACQVVKRSSSLKGKLSVSFHTRHPAEEGILGLSFK